MSTIAVTQLSKRFGTLIAVDSANLRVDAGEVLCLLGPSGCGKTTMLRMIAGLETATAGEIRIGDQVMTDWPPRQRNISMVFQFYALYPSLTVAENLAYPLHIEKLGRGEIERRVRAIAAKLDLTQVLDRRPSQLAEGEKQRVAVGRAIIRDPNCFLFDEPLSRLDIELRQTMRGQIKEVLAGLSKATVIVTHDQLEALTMADRIAVMRDGRIEQVATPHDIFTQPCNLFVAGFIGTPQMNLLPATLLEHGAEGRARLRVGTQTLWLPVSVAAQRLAAGANVTLGIRPRAFEVVAEAGDDTLSATAELIEPLGAETLVHMLEDGRDMRVVLRRGATISAGERVHLRGKAGQIHLFDAKGERL
ncbi:MAG: ABC transporter ATP-binding protein [Gammaproteobacteria bacterium]